MLSRRSALKLGGAALATAAIGTAVQAMQPLRIVATTGMLADAVTRVAGDAAEVRALMGPGVDPHSYRQTRSDIVAMTRADLVVSLGLYLEAQMEAFFDKLAARGTVYAAAEVLPQDRLRGHDDYEDKYDPHVWMVPEMWAQVVTGLRDRLTEVQPGFEATFAANAEAHLAEIAVLGRYARDTLSSVPKADRVLLSAHDAFGYLGEAYGFDVLGIQGISTESEAGLNRISALVDLIVTRGIRAVFVESSVSDRNIRALVEGAASRGHAVRIGGELFSDAMGAPGTYEGTYIGMIDHNVTTIAQALGGKAPERGMQGKLSAGA